MVNTFGAAPARALVDPQTRIVSIDGSLAAALGYDPDSLVGVHLSAIVADEELPSLGTDLAALVEGRFEVVTDSRRLRCADDSTIGSVLSVQRHLADGRLVGFDLAVLVDDADTALPPVLPDHLRRLAVAAALVDGRGVIVDANVEWGQLYALPDAVAPGGDLTKLVSADDRSDLVRVLDELRTGEDSGRQIEVRARSDQGEFWARLSLAKVGTTAEHFTVTTEDISRQHVEQRVLQANEALFRSIAEASPIGIARLSPDLAITYANPAFERLAGADEVRDGLASLFVESDRARVLSELRTRIDERSSLPINARLCADGRSVRLRISPVPDDEVGTIAHILSVDDGAGSSSGSAGPGTSVDDVVLVVDAGTRAVVYRNPAAADLFGPDRVDVDELWADPAQGLDRSDIAATLGRGDAWSGRLTMLDASGDPVDLALTAAAELGSDGRPVRVSVLGRRIDGDAVTDADRIDELVHRATHDPLTGLPNRGLLLDRLGHAIARSARDHTPIAVLFIDLDRFKEVNDRHGHDAGDAVLRAVAERVSQVLRPSDTVARLGGDEFVVLCEDLDSIGAAHAIADRVGRAIEGPVSVAGGEVAVSASIGIALSNGGAVLDPAALLQRSDAAMYRAKQGGRARVEIFDEVLRDRSRRRRELADQLTRAIDDRSLEVHYQPVVDLVTGRIVAVEALVRWLHPTRGLMAPAGFLDIAAESHVEAALDRLVLSRALDDAARWKGRFGDDAPAVHVNVFASTIASGALTDVLPALLAQSGADPRGLFLELPERVLTAASDELAEPMRRLRALGVSFVVDDVGTGATVLAQLAGGVVSMLKVDGSVVARYDRGGSEAAVLGAAVALGHALELTVVVEAVERRASVPELASLGVDLAQGNVFCAPAAATEIERLFGLRAAIVAG